MQLGYVVILSEAKNPCFREDTCESLILRLHHVESV